MYIVGPRNITRIYILVEKTFYNSNTPSQMDVAPWCYKWTDGMGLDISGWGEVESTYSTNNICLQVAFQFYFTSKTYKVERKEE